MSSYINHAPWRGHAGHDWRENMLARVLWTHGAERAWAVRNGNDAETSADLDAWNRLGRGRDAA